MKTFWIRTASAVVYVLLFVGSIYSGQLLGNQNIGTFILTAFLLFVAMGSTFELYRIVEKQGSRPTKVLGYAYVFATLVTLSLMAVDGMALFRLSSLVIFFMLLPVLVAVALIVQLWGRSERPFADAAYTVLPVFYVAWPLGLMPMIHVEYHVLMMLVFLVWVNDCFAYIGGSLLGRHKLWLRHSPGKTWEGSACGMLVCMAVALWVGPMFQPNLHWYDWLVLGLICSVIDTLGDLVESMLKRSVGMKDSGNIMPGHGGFLDRFDSLLIIVPFAFAYLEFFTSL